jgi:hypothetical protein
VIDVGKDRCRPLDTVLDGFHASVNVESSGKPYDILWIISNTYR